MPAGASVAAVARRMMMPGSEQKSVEGWAHENVVLLVKVLVRLAAKMMAAVEGIPQTAVDNSAGVAQGSYVVQPLPNLSKEHPVIAQDLAVARKFGPSKVSDDAAAAGLSEMTHSLAPFSKMVASVEWTIGTSELPATEEVALGQQAEYLQSSFLAVVRRVRRSGCS